MRTRTDEQLSFIFDLLLENSFSCWLAFAACGINGWHISERALTLNVCSALFDTNARSQFSHTRAHALALARVCSIHVYPIQSGWLIIHLGIRFKFNVFILITQNEES